MEAECKVSVHLQLHPSVPEWLGQRWPLMQKVLQNLHGLIALMCAGKYLQKLWNAAAKRLPQGAALHEACRPFWLSHYYFCGYSRCIRRKERRRAWPGELASTAHCCCCTQTHSEDAPKFRTCIGNIARDHANPHDRQNPLLCMQKVGLNHWSLTLCHITAGS